MRYDDVRQYIVRGWSVIPLRGATASVPKAPALKEWTEYQQKAATPEQWKNWLNRTNSFNVGVVCGPVSGVFVLDIDPKADLDYVRDTYGIDFNSPNVVRTGRGGFHVYFACPDDPPPNRVKFRPDMDTRSLGGYVVAPPSVHENGIPYVWACEAPPDFFPPIPEALLDDISASANASPVQFEAKIEKGERDHGLTARVGRLFGAGISEDDVLPIALSLNKTHCVPPLPVSQVKKIVQSIAKREGQRNSSIDLDTLDATIEFEDDSEPQEPKKATNAKSTTPIDIPIITPTPVQVSPRVAESKQSTGFEMVGLSSFMDRFGGFETPWAVDQWLPESTCGLCIADPGQYKTWMLAHLAVSVASGTPFLGQFAVNTVGPVVIIQQEDPFGLIADRLAAVLNTGNVSEECDGWTVPFIPERLMPPIYLHTQRELRFDKKDIMESLYRMIKKYQPALVLIDPLYSAGSTDDYMAKTAQQMLTLKSFRDRTGCGFFVAHHKKRHSDDAKRTRDELWGSQFLNAWLETGWQFSPDSASSIIAYRNFKNSKAKAPVKINFNIDDGSFEATVDEHEHQEMIDRVADAVQNGHVKSVGQLCADLGIKSKSTAQAMLKQLGAVKDNNGVYRITEIDANEFS